MTNVCLSLPWAPLRTGTEHLNSALSDAWATCVTEPRARAKLLQLCPSQSGDMPVPQPELQFSAVSPSALQQGLLLAAPLLNKLSNENHS